jgi:hypothetical protein
MLSQNQGHHDASAQHAAKAMVSRMNGTGSCATV